jgi:hypothetical protein
MHHFYDINVSAMLILLATCVQDGGWRSAPHAARSINIDFIILQYHFNNYWIITHTALPNSEPYNKLFRIVFWDVLPCKMIVDRRFRGAYCLHHQGSEIIIHGSTSQKTILNIILAAVRTWNLTYNKLFTATEDGHLMAKTRMVTNKCVAKLLAILY